MHKRNVFGHKEKCSHNICKKMEKKLVLMGNKPDAERQGRQLPCFLSYAEPKFKLMYIHTDRQTSVCAHM